MSLSEAERVMRDLVRAYNERDPEVLRELLTADAALQDYPAMPDAEWHVGPEGGIQWAAKWISLFPDGQLEVFDFRSAGDRFFYAYRGSGHGKLSGAWSEFVGWGVFTVEQGKLSRLELYSDKRDALEAAGLSE